MEEEVANFPQLPLPRHNKPGAYNTRKFKVGEPVALRYVTLHNFPDGVTRGRYAGSYSPNGDNKAASHKISLNKPSGRTTNAYVHWHSVGKIRQPISATASKIIAKEKNLPDNIATSLSKYGGRKKTRRLKRKSRKGVSHRRHK
jgi:hypothetical protein